MTRENLEKAILADKNRTALLCTLEDTTDLIEYVSKCIKHDTTPAKKGLSTLKVGIEAVELPTTFLLPILKNLADTLREELIAYDLVIKNL